MPLVFLWIGLVLGLSSNDIAEEGGKCSDLGDVKRTYVTIGKNATLVSMTQTLEVYWYRESNATGPWISISANAQNRNLTVINYTEPRSSWRIQDVAAFSAGDMVMTATILSTETINQNELGFYLYGDKKGLVGCYRVMSATARDRRKGRRESEVDVSLSAGLGLLVLLVVVTVSWIGYRFRRGERRTETGQGGSEPPPTPTGAV